VAETGISLLAISLPDRQIGLQVVFYLLVPRALAMGVWALSVSVFNKRVPSLKFADLQGLARSFPLATAGLVLSNLALAGAPLLASFPVRLALWENLSALSLPSALWFGISTVGLWAAALRSLAVLSMAPETIPWQSQETWEERILIGLGLLGLFIFGLFPQWALPFLANLPAMFEHLGK